MRIFDFLTYNKVISYGISRNSTNSPNFTTVNSTGSFGSGINVTGSSPNITTEVVYHRPRPKGLTPAQMDRRLSFYENLVQVIKEELNTTKNNINLLKRIWKSIKTT